MKKEHKIIAIVIAAVIGIAILIGSMIAIFGKDNKTNTNITTQSTSQPSYNHSQSAEENKTTPKETTTSAPTTTRSPEEVKQEYIADCQTYTFKEIARTPDKYKGKKAKITGEVVQVQRTISGYELRVDITKNEYGYYSDTIYVTYTPKSSDEPRILDDDIITIYGELAGEKTYQSVSDTIVTIPFLKGEYIDILTE